VKFLAFLFIDSFIVFFNLVFVHFALFIYSVLEAAAVVNKVSFVRRIREEQVRSVASYIAR